VLGMCTDARVVSLSKQNETIVGGLRNKSHLRVCLKPIEMRTREGIWMSS
jgi:hypothetical protein